MLKLARKADDEGTEASDSGEVSYITGGTLEKVAAILDNKEIRFVRNSSKSKPPAAVTERKLPVRPIPAGFALTDDLRLYAKEKAPHVDCDRATEEFINHAHSKDRRCARWDRAWMNWMLKAEGYAAKHNGKPSVKTDAILERHESFVESMVNEQKRA